jgi:hypothetical protein
VEVDVAFGTIGVSFRGMVLMIGSNLVVVDFGNFWSRWNGVGELVRGRGRGAVGRRAATRRLLGGRYVVEGRRESLGALYMLMRGGEACYFQSLVAYCRISNFEFRKCG